MAYTGKVFSFQHNWAQPLKERLQLPCDVQIADDGTEKRRSLRLHPLRSYEFSVVVNGPLRAYFDALLATSLTEEVLLPIRHDGIRLSADLASGSTALSFDTSYLDLDEGAYFLFWRDYKTYEAVEITAVTPTGIEFEATGTTWPRGTKGFPARLANFDPNVQGVTIANDLKARTVKFDISPRSISANRYGDFTWPTLDINGDDNPITLWLNRSESSDDRSDSIAHEADIERTLTGVASAFETRKVAPYNSFGFHQLTNTRVEVAEWVAFWKSRYGRRLPFWMPTWEKDFLQVPPVGSSPQPFKWQSNGYTEFYNLIDYRSTLFFYRADDDYEVARLTTCQDNGDGTEQGTGSGVPGNQSWRRVSYLRYCRMESDTLEIDWFTAGKARSETTFRELFKVP
jgi:hypothetical protein